MDFEHPTQGPPIRVLLSATLEFYDIAPVLIYTRMIFNFNSKAYCFSSAIPDKKCSNLLTLWTLNYGRSVEISML